MVQTHPLLSERRQHRAADSGAESPRFFGQCQTLTPNIDHLNLLGQWFQHLAQVFIFKLLAKMSRGHLVMTLPEGQKVHFGDDVNEENPHNTPQTVFAEIQVLDWAFFSQCLLFGDIGLAEGYMAGYWDTPDVSAVIRWFIVNTDESTGFKGNTHRINGMNGLGFLNRIQHWLKPNSHRFSRVNIQAHYDLSNDFFALFLDKTMAYSAGIFSHPELDLEMAQLEKYETLCQKLRLTPEDYVLEIGSGWGGFAIYAVKNYGCRIRTITLSQQQFEWVSQKIDVMGLADRIQVELRDYRTLQEEPKGQYTKIVSIEMIEAVGDAYYEAYFKTLNHCLAPDGLVAIQAIICPDSRYDVLKNNVDFIQKHIFPGSLLPSLARLNQAMNNVSSMTLFEVQDYGLSYARTLREWDKRFKKRALEVKALGFDAVFLRKWHYYLQYCQAAFETRNISVVQILYTHPNNSTLMALH